MNRYEQAKKISELIDVLDRIREELLMVQRSLEPMEKPDLSAADIPQVTGDDHSFEQIAAHQQL